MTVFVHLPLFDTWLPDSLSSSVLSPLVFPIYTSWFSPLAGCLSFLPLPSAAPLSYPSLLHSSLQHKSRSHNATSSAASSCLTTFISFNHFLFPSNTRLLPTSTHEHVRHSSCHYSLIFSLVIISVAPASPTALSLQLLTLSLVYKKIAVIWGLWQKLKHTDITGFVLSKSELPCKLYYLRSQLSFY